MNCTPEKPIRQVVHNRLDYPLLDVTGKSPGNAAAGLAEGPGGCHVPKHLGGAPRTLTPRHTFACTLLAAGH